MNRLCRQGCRVLALVMLCSLAKLGPALAAPVNIGGSSFSDNVIVMASSPLAVSDFYAGVAGTVSLVVTDLQLGDLLSSLSTSITLFDGSKLQLNGSSSAVFDIGANQRFTTSIYAQTSGARGWGVYNLDVSFIPTAPIPLPLGGLLLLAGCGVLATRVRRARAGSIAASA